MRSKWITAETFEAGGTRDFTREIAAVFFSAHRSTALDGSPRAVLYFSPPGKLDVRPEDVSGLRAAFGADSARWLGRRVALRLARTPDEIADEPPAHPELGSTYREHEVWHGCITCRAAEGVQP